MEKLEKQICLPQQGVRTLEGKKYHHFIFFYPLVPHKKKNPGHAQAVINT